MTFSTLNADTNKVVSRSNVRPEDKPTYPNLRIYLLTAPEIVTSPHLNSDHLEDDEEARVVTEDEAPNASASLPKHSMPILDPNDLMESTFLIPQEDGQHLRARIVKTIGDYDGKNLERLHNTKIRLLYKR